MRGWLKVLAVAAGVLAAAALAACGFLAWRVIDARARTPAIIARIVAEADPDIRILSAERVRQYLAVEDPTFWTNDGIDLKTPGAGLTTTTQGLGKLIYFRPFAKGYWNKLQLIVMSKYALTPRASKRDIFIAALAMAPLGEVKGHRVVGLADAAHSYFGRPLRDLSDDQFLSLVAMQLGPEDYSPAISPAASAERVSRIKRLLSGACRPTGLNDVTLDGCAQPAGRR